MGPRVEKPELCLFHADECRVGFVNLNKKKKRQRGVAALYWWHAHVVMNDRDGAAQSSEEAHQAMR